MIEISSNNKRIAKNTLFLYFRMLLTMFVGLYTSRVLLNVLGVSDYGIYSVVGGMVYLMEFLRNGMTGASQRFMSYELGRGDVKMLNDVFCTTVSTHFIIAIVIALALETAGVWMLNVKMNIPLERLNAANWVLQFSIIIFVISVVNVPYTSSIIAHEHMNIYAHLSILDVSLKLAIVFIIQFSTFDKLIFYSLLLCSVQVLIQILYMIYCKKHFSECKYSFYFNKPLFKRIFSFAGWNMIGNLGASFKDQATNIVINIFCGTTVNAARGIAFQVNGIMQNFASNFSMAVNPQIIKQYAAGNVNGSINLIYSGVRFTCYLLSMVTIPFILNIDFILKLWLGTPPQYTNFFLCIILVNSVVYSMTHTVTTGIYATGNVKLFQTTVAFLMLLEVPSAYLILKIGAQPYLALVPSLFTMTLSLFLRITILKKYEPQCSIKKYFFDCVVRCTIIFVVCFCISYYIRSQMQDESILTVIFSTIVSILIFFIVVFLFGLEREEKDFLINKILVLKDKIL